MSERENEIVNADFGKEIFVLAPENNETYGATRSLFRIYEAFIQTIIFLSFSFNKVPS